VEQNSDPGSLAIQDFRCVSTPKIGIFTIFRQAAGEFQPNVAILRFNACPRLRFCYYLHDFLFYKKINGRPHPIVIYIILLGSNSYCYNGMVIAIPFEQRRQTKT